MKRSPLSVSCIREILKLPNRNRRQLQEVIGILDTTAHQCPYANRASPPPLNAGLSYPIPAHPILGGSTTTSALSVHISQFMPTSYLTSTSSHDYV